MSAHLPGQQPTTSALAPQQSLMDVCFKNPTVPSGAITAENVLAYFCETSNPFYDRQCDNETVRMQQMQGMQPQMGIQEALMRMNGIQYVLWLAQPPLFVICKQKRHNFNNAVPLCYYYVLDGTVYQAPDVYTLVQSRLVSALGPLREAMAESVKCLRFEPAKGHTWEFKSQPAKRSDEPKNSDTPRGRPKGTRREQEEGIEDPVNAPATHFQWTHTEALLKLLVEKFPPGEGVQIVNGGNATGQPRGQKSAPSVTNFRTNSSTSQVANAVAGGTADFHLHHIHHSSSTSAMMSANAPTPPATLPQPGMGEQSSIVNDSQTPASLEALPATFVRHATTPNSAPLQSATGSYADGMGAAQRPSSTTTCGMQMEE